MMVMMVMVMVIILMIMMMKMMTMVMLVMMVMMIMMIMMMFQGDNEGHSNGGYAPRYQRAQCRLNGILNVLIVLIVFIVLLVLNVLIVLLVLTIVIIIIIIIIIIISGCTEGHRCTNERSLWLRDLRIILVHTGQDLNLDRRHFLQSNHLIIHKKISRIVSNAFVTCSL